MQGRHNNLKVGDMGTKAGSISVVPVDALSEARDHRLARPMAKTSLTQGSHRVQEIDEPCAGHVSAFVVANGSVCRKFIRKVKKKKRCACDATGAGLLAPSGKSN